MARFEALFSSLTIKKISIRNRIVMPAMNTNFADIDGSVNERFTRYYVERGNGGAGLIIVSSAYVDPNARKRKKSLLLHEDRYIPKLKDFSKAIHATGAKVLQQLNHNGRLVTSSKELKTAVKTGSVGPSAVPHLLTGETPKILCMEEIKELIEKFGEAACRAKEAGFDGVEIHGGHGYLINQFFSLYSNRRKDEYGGNLENRMRFPLSVCRRVRELTGNDFVVGFRLSAQEYAPIETPIQDVIELSQRLEKEGVDLLHISAGNAETPTMMLKIAPPGSTLPGCYADLAAAIKAKVSVPIIAVGRINTPEIAEQILREGKADLVATGRALIADPYWPKKAYRGDLKRIRRCIGCHEGCSERLAKENSITCIYNPEVGREGEFSSSTEKKKVWVIGGGPGGMEAATIVALRGHRVDLYEKKEELGGQSLLAAMPPGKEDFLSIREYLINELKRQKVTIHLKEEVTAEKVIRNQPDVVILATGCIPFIPKIPGIKGENVVTAWDVLEGREVGEKVTVIGGGLVGVETALYLARSGKQVVLIEMFDEINQDAGAFNRVCLKQALEKTKIEVKCRTELLRIGKKKVTVRDEKGEYDIPSDTIILALGAKAQDSLYPILKNKVPELYAVGDCVRPRRMLDAIHEAYEIALKI
jgi:2,4-dienoyl-CoA reductase-like NADH-dependent reductase (Old Yellow Enzyme family)/thioredoxin reductase